MVCYTWGANCIIRQLVVKTSLLTTGVQQCAAECIAHLLLEVLFCFLKSQHWLSNLFFSYKKNSSDYTAAALCISILNTSQTRFSFQTYMLSSHQYKILRNYLSLFQRRQLSMWCDSCKAMFCFNRSFWKQIMMIHWTHGLKCCCFMLKCCCSHRW